MRYRKTLPILLVLLIAVGCAKTVRAPIPGAANQFDSDTYTSLVTAKGVIDQAKAELSAGSFSAGVAAKVKEAVNYAVAAYNTANVTYVAYHNAALAGQATSAQQQAVSSSMSNLNTAVSNVTTAKAAQ